MATAPTASPASWAAGARRSRADTTTVVLEAANFERVRHRAHVPGAGPAHRRATAWIRGVDPELAPPAPRGRAELLVELAGGQMLPGDQDVSAPLPERERIVLRTRLRGADPRHADRGRRGGCASCARLGFEPRARDRSARRRRDRADLAPEDTTREIDLVEEVGRIHGLEQAAGDDSRPHRRRRLADAGAGRAPPRRGGAGRRRAAARPYTLSLVDGGPGRPATASPTTIRAAH